MKKIHMVDVVTEYQSYSSEIQKVIRDVLSSGAYIQGNKVKSFEALLCQYLNLKYTISCGNGTDALQVALMALNLNAGDEVLVPSFTFVSTVETVCLLGLKPVFIDIDPETFLLDSNCIENNISRNTKAIIPVHLFGQCCNMQEIRSIAKQFDLYIIEDAAQSIGSQCFVDKKWNFSGTIGHIGTTSFYPSKNLGCVGDGGAIFTNDSQLAKNIRLIVNHGQEERYKYKVIGINSRLDAIQASILSFKLSLLDEFIAKRQKAADFYNNELSVNGWLKTPKTQTFSSHVYHQYSILLYSKINRKSFQNYLLEHGIPTMIYYPIPLHQQEAYKSYAKDNLPVSEEISQRILSLPMHPHLTIEQLDFICQKIKQFN